MVSLDDGDNTRTFHFPSLFHRRSNESIPFPFHIFRLLLLFFNFLLGIILGILLGHFFKFLGFLRQLLGNIFLKGMIGLGRLQEGIDGL